MSAAMAAMSATWMQTVPTLLALIIVHVRKDLLEMDARVQEQRVSLPLNKTPDNLHES